MKLIIDIEKSAYTDLCNGHTSDAIREAVLKGEPIKYGSWIPERSTCKCSACGHHVDARGIGAATHYCSFCGANMWGEEDESHNNR